jgi:hypothetical protein
MAILGIILIVAALAAAVFGFVQHRAAKKLLEAPFHKTGQVAANPSLADAKGLISFEGDVRPLQQLVAPVSGRPCLYFEVEVERLWKKWEVTENGSTERSGKSNVRTDRAGSVFAVDDGSGPMQVDAREGVKADAKDMLQSFEQTINMSSGNSSIGQYQFNVPASMSSDEHTYGVRVVERVIEAQGHMFVAGKHSGQMVSKADGMMGSLRLSKRGRDALIGAQKKNAMIGFALAGVTGITGIPTTIFGDMPSGGGNSCAAVFEAGEVTKAEGCTNKVTSKSGDSYTWNVKSDAEYSIDVEAPKGVKYPIWQGAHRSARQQLRGTSKQRHLQGGHPGHGSRGRSCEAVQGRLLLRHQDHHGECTEHQQRSAPCGRGTDASGLVLPSRSEGTLQRAFSSRHQDREDQLREHRRQVHRRRLPRSRSTWTMLPPGRRTLHCLQEQGDAHA